MTLQRIDAEQAVLGACLRNADAAKYVVSTLTPQDFTLDKHAAFFRCVIYCTSHMDPVDPMTVYYAATLLRQTDLVGPTLSDDLLDACPSAANVAAYVRIVQQMSTRRRLLGVYTGAMEAIEDLSRDPIQVSADAAKDALEVTGEPQDPEADRLLAPEKFSDVLDRFLEQLHAGPAPTIPTPYPTLNYYLDGGFSPGELIYLGGRPGQGKTNFALEVSRYVAGRGTPVLVISREMVNTSLAKRIVSQSSRVPSSVLKRGTMTTDQWKDINRQVTLLSQIPLYMTDQAESIKDIDRMVSQMMTKVPLGLIVADYLQLIHGPKEARSARERVEYVSAGMKSLAMRTRVPVLCLSSLSRPKDGDESTRPTMGSYRESGEIEHDCDWGLLLHRAPDATETECIVAKSRDGSTGVVKLQFREKIVSFYEEASGVDL
jgi:replicative DNA helicase